MNWNDFKDARVKAIAANVGNVQGRDIDRAQLLMLINIQAQLETITVIILEKTKDERNVDME